MSESTERARALEDYPLSLRMAAEALWGDDFWGRHAPRVVTPPPRRKSVSQR